MNKTTNELTYSEIRSKCVVDAERGRNLGHVCDMVFTSNLKSVVGIIAPFEKREMFGKSQDVFIPVNCIDSIGEDVVIVNIGTLTEKADCNKVAGCNPPPPPKDVPPPSNCADLSECDRPQCDHRCDKCMLFDCRFRWKGKAL